MTTAKPTERGDSESVSGRGNGWRGLGRGWPARLFSLAILTLSVWSAARVLSGVWRFTIDDAGISYGYAKHLAEGSGPVAVVGGPWVEGYSNPLWVFLLATLHALGLEPPRAAKWLGVAFLVTTLFAGLRVLWVVRDAPRFRLDGSDLTWLISLTGTAAVGVWVVAGLENPLYSALAIGLVAFDVLERREPSRAGLSGACAFALAITRPEGLAWAAPLLVLKAFDAWRSPAHRRQAQAAVLLFLVPLLLYHLGHFLVFRQLLPNTYFAKPARGGLDQGFEYLVDGLSHSGFVWLLPLSALGCISQLRDKLLLAGQVLAGVLFVLYSGGDWMPHARFVSMILPGLGLLAALGVHNLVRLVSRLSSGRAPGAIVAGCLGVAFAVPWLRQQAPLLERISRRPWCHFCERLSDMRGVQALTRKAGLDSTTLLTHDFGGPSWVSDESLYPLDFLGLCDRSVALIRQDRVRRGGSMKTDFRFHQYLFHEQPSPPGILYVPPNFWPDFDRSPEFRLGYLSLSPRLLGRRARRDAYFGLHRSELVDYFPPLEPMAFRSIGGGLTLAGYGAVRADEGAAGGRA
jgi:hypothetical protein